MGGAAGTSPPHRVGYERQTFDFSQSTFGGHLACTSIATLVACSMADSDDVARFEPEDKTKMEFLVKFGSGLWKENTMQGSDESVQSIIDKHSFFKIGVNYDNQSYQGVVGDCIEEGRIKLKPLLKELYEIKKTKGSAGAVITDNVVSFAVGLVSSPSNRWVIFDSHAPCARLFTAPEADVEYVAKTVTSLMCKRHGLFDCTIFWRHVAQPQKSPPSSSS